MIRTWLKSICRRLCRRAGTGMDHLKFLGKLVDELIVLSPQLKFDKKDAIDIRRAMLYATLIELAHSVHTLLTNGSATGIRILMRSALEAHVDLVNLLKDADYFDNLEAQNHKEWLRLYGAAEEGNEFIQVLAEHPQFQGQYDLAEQELAELKAKGRHPLNIAEKFELAGIESVYRSVYVMMCSEAHNNQTGLVSRHIEVGNDGDIELHFRKKLEMARHVPVLDSLCGILVNGAKGIHKEYGEGEEAIKVLDRELTELRAPWLKKE